MLIRFDKYKIIGENTTLMRIASSVSELIGDTPLLRCPTRNQNWELFLKMENSTPARV